MSVAQVHPGVLRVLAPNPSPMTLDGTNTYVLRTPAGAVVVDPGPLHHDHLGRVAAAAGGEVSVVLLTHRHPDHAEGAAQFADSVRAPLVDGSAVADGTDGAVGVAVLHTPGHTGDSACFLFGGAVLTGDTVLGRGTTVVAYPDGRLGDYLASLRRLASLGDRVVLPGHGPVLPSVRAATEAYLAHREQRLDQVRAAVDAGARTPAEVVRVVYADVDPALWPAAELSVRAQLAYLRDPICAGIE